MQAPAAGQNSSRVGDSPTDLHNALTPGRLHLTGNVLPRLASIIVLFSLEAL